MLFYVGFRKLYTNYLNIWLLAALFGTFSSVDKKISFRKDNITLNYR